MKKGLGINVLEAAKQRISLAFDKTERQYVSFSAGKDSTVMLHLVMDEAMKRGKKVGVLLIDLEGQYKLTIEHALECFEKYKDHIEPYWVCLPIHLRNAVSVFSPFWKCWDANKKEAWIRDIPTMAISDPSFFPFFSDGMEFEEFAPEFGEFAPEFGEWYSQGKPTACFVGIRSDESLNRYRTIASDKKAMFENYKFTSKVTDHCYNFYPIYDWKVEDIWVYHGKNPDRRWNHLYDYMYKAGLSFAQMRICQPYGDDQRKGLWLFHLIEPETWSRVVARVNGANGGALYVQEWGNINGYRKVTKPEGHTWKSFAYLLMNSMPRKTGEHFKNKIWKFIEWWSKRGYEEGIPDEADYDLEQKKLAPSWRRVCKSLLRNDFWCKGMGFTQQKSDAYEKYLKFMKEKRKEKVWIEA